MPRCLHSDDNHTSENNSIAGIDKKVAKRGLYIVSFLSDLDVVGGYHQSETGMQPW